MKFNLKNRPKLKHSRGIPLGRYDREETIRWFEGFEKELKEKIEYFGDGNTDKSWNELFETFKEILGE